MLVIPLVGTVGKFQVFPLKMEILMVWLSEVLTADTTGRIVAVISISKGAASPKVTKPPQESPRQ